jgi:hypothetical protein
MPSDPPISTGSTAAASIGPAVHAAALALSERIVTLGSNPTDPERRRRLVQSDDGRRMEAKADSNPVWLGATCTVSPWH